MVPAAAKAAERVASVSLRISAGAVSSDAENRAAESLIAYEYPFTEEEALQKQPMQLGGVRQA